MGERSSPERADFDDIQHAGYFGDHAARYVLASRWVPGCCVIDAACGSGYGSALLKQFGATKCIGIDGDADAVQRNHDKYSNMGIEFQVADCQTFDYGVHHPDVIVSFETIEHLNEPDAFLREVSRGLKSDGLFLVSCPNNEELGQNPFHVNAWDATRFREQLLRYFEDVVVVGQVRNPSATATEEFGRYLDFRVGVLWNQPWTRAWRQVRRLLNRAPEPARPEWPDILAGPYDWWFVPDYGPSAAALLGICRKPKQ